MWDDPRQMNAISAAILVLAFAALSWSALSWLVRQPAFEFHKVVVRTHLLRADPVHLEAAIRDDLYGTFFTMDLDKSRAALARVPWVRKVAMRRQWPHALEITIEEHTPLARWNEAMLIDMQGELFKADYHGELPHFNGPDSYAANVTAQYREWSRALAPLGLTLQDVTMSARGGWRLRASGTSGPIAIELGRDEPGARLARFVATYRRTIGALARNGTRIEQVDLRYRNGFAARVPGFKERAPKKPA
jgi:cell division protein FtsQ